MAAPRRPPQLAIIEAHARKSRFRGALTSSVLAHVLLLFVAVYEPSCLELAEPPAAPGGPGPRGGGGGGGGEVIGYMQLPAYIPPQAETPQPQEAETPPEEMVLVIPQPQIADVQPADAALRDRRPLNLAEVLGRGDGTGGGAGQGTGSGGGQGSGVGTGIGSDRGPGTGGDGGDIFPPTPIHVTLPPPNPPSGVKGREHTIRFLVSENGQVMEIQFITPVRDAGYRRLWLARLREYRFTPGTTRDGVAVATTIDVTLTP